MEWKWKWLASSMLVMPNGVRFIKETKIIATLIFWVIANIISRRAHYFCKYKYITIGITKRNQMKSSCNRYVPRNLNLTQMEDPQISGLICQCLNISHSHHKQLLFQNHNQIQFLFHSRRQLQIPGVIQGTQAQLLHLFNHIGSAINRSQQKVQSLTS